MDEESKVTVCALKLIKEWITTQHTTDYSASREQTFNRLPTISGQIFENWIVYPTINYTQSKMQLIENRTKKDILTL